MKAHTCLRCGREPESGGRHSARCRIRRVLEDAAEFTLVDVCLRTALAPMAVGVDVAARAWDVLLHSGIPVRSYTSKTIERTK